MFYFDVKIVIFNEFQKIMTKLGVFRGALKKQLYFKSHGFVGFRTSLSATHVSPDSTQRYANGLSFDFYNRSRNMPNSLVFIEIVSHQNAVAVELNGPTVTDIPAAAVVA